jgi:eukaryotic-like serine/threonine-protein kinase
MAEREQQVTSIFHSAIAREPHERAPYLDGACGDDKELRQEVEELLRSHENAGSFTASPEYERGADLLEGEVPRTRAGQSIGPYKIVSLIGAGGMGEVYRANDARLGREVALKLLPESTTRGTESVRRFQQEARAASALNHPNILSIYDIGEHQGSPYIVSELLTGETLREKLSGVPLTTRKALDYALQAARGLAAAHEKGIVHRDLKPENLFVTKDGRVKILDFGIAKLVEQKSTGALHTEAPTLLVKTDPGMVIGTAGYMSPEQVRGTPVDHRSDIFSFGAIFYEMLSGKRAFRGESMIETLNAILKEEPPELATTNSQIAPEIARVVRRCLEKQPEERFQSASDLAFAIESLSGTQVSGSTNAVTAVTASATKGVRRTLRDQLGWIVAAILLASILALVAFYYRRAEPRAEVIRFTLPAPEKLSFGGELALSPDGRKLAFVVEGPSGKSLWVRTLDSIEARELPGTGEAALPFWSPDSRFIAFFASKQTQTDRPCKRWAAGVG